jgi:hypothetical protein
MINLHERLIYLVNNNLYIEVFPTIKFYSIFISTKQIDFILLKILFKYILIK